MAFGHFLKNRVSDERNEAANDAYLKRPKNKLVFVENIINRDELCIGIKQEFYQKKLWFGSDHLPG